MLRKLFRNRKGQSIVEYVLLLVGITLVSLAAVSILGHKTASLWAAFATTIPGVHPENNNPISAGGLIETTVPAPGDTITLDLAQVLANSGTDRVDTNVYDGQFATELELLVVDYDLP